MTIGACTGLALATLVFALIPGPGVVALVAQTLGRGFGRGVVFAAGLVLGDLVYLLMAMFGMGWLAGQLGGFFVLLKWLGAGYLIWLGLKCLLAKPPKALATADSAARDLSRNRLSAFGAGLCVSLGNPKVIAFYCGFLPGFIDMSRLTALDVVQVIAIILPTVFLVITGYAWLASQGRRAAQGARMWKILHRTAGSVMVGAGVAVAAE